MEKDHDLHQVSVVVPVHNGRRHLAEVIGALMAGLRPGDELVVVDDRSTDGSGDMAAEMGAGVIQSTGRPGAAGARNTGAASTDRRWILFVDSDAVVPQGWRSLLEERIEQGVDAVQAVYSREAVGSGAATFYKNFYYHYTFTKRIRKTDITGCGTFFFAVSREAFTEVGGFDENIAGATIEDADFAERLTAAGGVIRLAPEIEVFHLREYTFPLLMKYDWNMMRAKALYILRRDRRLGRPSVSMASPGEMLPVITGAIGVWAVPAGLLILALGDAAGAWIALAGFLVLCLGQTGFWTASIKQGGFRGAMAGLVVVPDLLIVIPACIAALFRSIRGRKY